MKVVNQKYLDFITYDYYAILLYISRLNYHQYDQNFHPTYESY